MKTIDLESLVGEHTLSGAFFDQITETRYGYKETSQLLRFTLDGFHYEAIEDPDDGYRSMLKRIQTTDTAPENTFPAVRVVAEMKANDRQFVEDIILQIKNAQTGKVIIEIGTSDASDYYPGFVAYFSPENL